MLHAVNDALKSPNPQDSTSASSYLVGVISKAESHMDDFGTWIKSIQCSRSRSGLTCSGKITHVFGQNEQKSAEFQKGFGQIKSDLNIGLNLITMTMSQLQPRALMCIQRSTTLDAAGHAVSLGSETHPARVAALIDEFVARTADEEVVPETNDQIERPPPTYSEAMVGQPQALPSSQSGAHIVFQMQSIIRGCDRHCRCQCHIPFERHSYQWLWESVGSLFFSTSGIPCLNRRACNIKSCRSGVLGQSKFQLQYSFPSWLLRRSYLSCRILVSSRGHGGKVKNFQDARRKLSLA